ncbi:E3 ubiquitin-protein ligase RNF14-like isoform X2 [Plectropomus leopardus]|uniref:E3 ubiquitin-protein ligase RNF14-like isoform X2 n=1 Tax=Plectropomus leopardus TaxID=160734 RepID=UPI001C4DA7BD|nr:E3 ubiquitin-protein ligase RNF14-like isoform X2 [Plectropomus leopardus]
MNADREEQEDELLALHSIFDSEEFVRDESKFAGEIRVCFELPAGFTVTLKEGETLRQYEIASLPPLLLTFELPEDYPSTSPPSFTVTCSWLTHAQLSALSAQLTDLYEASGGTVVLFSWVQFLKEDALGFLDISSLLELPSDEYSTKCDQHSKPGHTDSCNVSDPCKPDLSAPALEVEHLIATLEDDLDPSRTSDSQEAVALTQNTSNDSNRTAQASDHLGEAEETLQKSETKADYQIDLSSAASKSKSLLFSQSDQSGRKDFSNEGNDSAPLLLPSSSSDPLDQSELGAASLPTHPRESPQNEDHTLSGLSLTPSQTLLSQILIYNEAQKQKAFAATVFDCGVCFTGCLGSDCVQLPECRHIFCQTCLAEFCKLQITEGNVRGVTCPEADCTATPTPAQVRRLVGEELFSRYDRLLLQSTLDSMADVVYCPRRSCGSAVIRDKSSNAALCFVCSFAFCVTCRKTYHGTDCQGKKNTKLLEAQQGNADLPQTKEGLKALWDDYASGSKQRRRLLESRYGRSTMQGTLEDSLSENWIITNSKNCPHCFCRIEKNKGCNMMTCTQCGQRFCWACLARLGTGRIGDHFTSNGCSHYEY